MSFYLIKQTTWLGFQETNFSRRFFFRGIPSQNYSLNLFAPEKFQIVIFKIPGSINGTMSQPIRRLFIFGIEALENFLHRLPLGCSELEQGHTLGTRWRGMKNFEIHWKTPWCQCTPSLSFKILFVDWIKYGTSE